MCPTSLPDRPFVALASALLLSGLFVLPAAAQSPFTDCAHRTATNASLIVPGDAEIVVDGTRADGPLYVAVFTPEGKCAGFAEWTSKATTVTAWGTQDPAAPSSERSLAPGDSMHLRIYDPFSEREYSEANSRVMVSFRSGPPPFRSSLHFVPDGVYVLDEIEVERTLISRQE